MSQTSNSITELLRHQKPPPINNPVSLSYKYIKKKEHVIGLFIFLVFSIKEKKKKTLTYSYSWLVLFLAQYVYERYELDFSKISWKSLGFCSDAHSMTLMPQKNITFQIFFFSLFNKSSEYAINFSPQTLGLSLSGLSKKKVFTKFEIGL